MENDLAKVDGILDRYGRDQASLVMVLQDIQSEFRYLPPEAMQHVAEALDIPSARVFAVATFYKVFSLEPQGRTLVQICTGTACHVRGARLLQDEVCRKLEVPVGSTTEDLEYTVKNVNCVGACAMAPVLIVGDKYHGKVKPTRVGKLVAQPANVTAGGSDEQA